MTPQVRDHRQTLLVDRVQAVSDIAADMGFHEVLHSMLKNDVFVSAKAIRC